MRYLGGGAFNADRGLQYTGPNRPHTDSGAVVNDDIALTIGAIFRSIRIIAEVSALLPLRAYQRDGNGDLLEIGPDSPDAWLPKLIARPNPVMTGDQWREAMYAQMAGWGNGYSQITRIASGRPQELWPYKTDRMEVHRRPADLEVDYKYPDVNGSPQILPKGKVLHLKAFTLDGYTGISPLGCARNAAGLALQAERFAGSFYQAGGKPSGVMTSDRVLTPQQRDQINAAYGSMSDGSTGKRFWLLEGDLKYTPLTVNPEDLQMVATRAFQVSDVARFFGVPLFLLMESEKNTSWGSGIEQTNLAFLIYTLSPYLQDMAAAWNTWIIPERDQGRLCVEVDTDPLMAADFTSRANFLSSMAQNGLMTRNEGRKKLKLPKNLSPAADELTCQVNLVPIGQLGQTTAPQRAALQSAWQYGEDLIRRVTTRATEDANP
jgi:HK97 family phage portal protein